jgi:Signal transduction histidine kinase
MTQKHITYLDSINKAEKKTAHIEYGKKYQTEKKIQENELLQRDNAIKALTISKQNTLRNLFIVIILLLVLVAAVTYNQFRIKRKSEELLKEKNLTISNQNVALEEANATKKKFFSIIAHDLINPFNTIMGYSNLLYEDYDDFTIEQKRAFIGKINKAATLNFNLTKNLLNWAKSQQDKIQLSLEVLNCTERIEHAIKPYEIFARQKKIDTILDVPNGLNLKADANILSTVIGNIYNNAIKFSPQGGKIWISVRQHASYTTIEIKDSGVGMTKTQLDNLFDLTKVNSTRGTNQEKGNGLGLILCKELIHKHNGTLDVKSVEGEGTSVSIVLKHL